MNPPPPIYDRYFSCPREIVTLNIIITLNRGDATLKNVLKLAELFSAHILVLLNKYIGLINIPKVTSKIYLKTTTISAG